MGSIPLSSVLFTVVSTAQRQPQNANNVDFSSVCLNLLCLGLVIGLAFGAVKLFSKKDQRANSTSAANKAPTVPQISQPASEPLPPPAPSVKKASFFEDEEENNKEKP